MPKKMKRPSVKRNMRGGGVEGPATQSGMKASIDKTGAQTLSGDLADATVGQRLAGVSSKELGKHQYGEVASRATAFHKSVLGDQGWMTIMAGVLFSSMFLILLYKYVPVLYPIIPIVLVITIVCMGREDVDSQRVKYIGAFSLVCFFLARISSTYGIGGLSKGWLDNKYCDEIEDKKPVA